MHVSFLFFRSSFRRQPKISLRFAHLDTMTIQYFTGERMMQ